METIIEISYWLDGMDSQCTVRRGEEVLFSKDDVSGITVWELFDLLRALGHTVGLISLSDSDSRM